ncbi:hypothetical protein MtrunA17_Chr5g0404501 [Medicago truncatula]|uniref:Transmembrane protein n=1 Tax=Medicago truncatula TaxID=3880 RepID=A0A396HS60_MEDTR|nr:hypothetical protein MtrunA17_Chr5g0404501 [Medicago truncatula]
MKQYLFGLGYKFKLFTHMQKKKSRKNEPIFFYFIFMGVFVWEIKNIFLDSRPARLLYQRSWAAQMRVSVTDIRAGIHHSVAVACQSMFYAELIDLREGVNLDQQGLLLIQQ